MATAARGSFHYDRLFLRMTRYAFVMQGSTVAHDGQRMRVFTIKPLRDVGDPAQQNIDSFLGR
jgi:hypothetical protein